MKNRKENNGHSYIWNAVYVLSMAAFIAAAMLTGCSSRQRPENDTVRQSAKFDTILRYEREGEVLVFRFEGRRYTMFASYGSGKPPVVLHIQDAKELNNKDTENQ
jgi:hypothetical protein